MPDTLSPLPMKEAEAYWLSRIPVTDAEMKVLSERAKSRAFAVAGMRELDQVDAVLTSLQKALEEGQSFGTWKKAIGKDLEKKGLNTHHVRTIYQTNVQAAYSAGRYEQMTRVATARPYWRYVAVGDQRTRPAHLALHGRVARHDDAFWDTFYPPNGFNCRCLVQSLSERQLQKRGYTVSEGATGLPANVLPDMGFRANPGRDFFSGLAPTELDQELKDLRIPSKTPLPQIERRHIHSVKRGDILPANLKKAEYVEAFLSEFGLQRGESLVHELPRGIPVVIGEGFFVDKRTGQLKTQTNWAERGPYIRLLARTIKDPYEIWLAQGSLPSGLSDSLRLIRPFTLDGRTLGGYCSFHLRGGQWSAATAFMPKSTRSQKAILEYLEKERQGGLVYREP